MNVGGPATLLHDLIERLPKNEFSHTLLTGNCESNEIDFLDNYSIDSSVVRLPSFTRSIFLFNDARALYAIFKHLRKLNPDVIHTHTSKAGVLGRLAAKLAAPKAKVIHTYHGHLLYGYFSPSKTNLIVHLERFLARITSDLVAVTSQVMEELLVRGVGPKNKWTVIRPGLPFPLPVDKSLARTRMGIGQGDFVIAWVGRFTAIKNPVAMIEIAESVYNQALAPITIFMVGGGELLDSCRELAASRKLPIHFTGWVSEASEYFTVADLLVMTSDNEGMPVVIVEAALRGVPTLSTNVGGVAEFIVDNSTGFLAGSAKEIPDLILKLVEDRKHLEIVSQAALALAKSEFSVEMMVSKHLEIYRDKN